MIYMTNLYLNKLTFAFYMLKDELTNRDLSDLIIAYAALFRVDSGTLAQTRECFDRSVYRGATDRSKTYMLSRMHEMKSERFSDFEKILIPIMVKEVEIVDGLCMKHAGLVPGINTLEHLANGENMNAIALLAFLLREGIILKKDLKEADRLIRKGAAYHDLDCMIMALEKKSDPMYSAILRAMLSKYSTGNVLSLLQETTKASQKKNRYNTYAYAFEKLFDQSLLRRDEIEVTVSTEAVEKLAELPFNECCSALKNCVGHCRSSGQSEITLEDAVYAIRNRYSNRIGF